MTLDQTRLGKRIPPIALADLTYWCRLYRVGKRFPAGSPSAGMWTAKEDERWKNQQ